jgi:Fe-S cluster biosynthesis and repair protein YggX
MRTIRTKIYNFSELSKEAQQNAFENYRNNYLTFDFIYSDAESTVKAFCDAFSVKSGSRSWLDCNTSNIDDNILNLTGLRLRKYILNNFGDTLYKRKYLKSGGNSKNLKPFHRMRKQNEIKSGPNKGLFYSIYYSNICKVAQNCNLTGMCYDDDMMRPIYDFLELRTFSSTNFEDLLNECFNEMRNTLEKEKDYMETDEYITEEIEANEYEYTEEGNKF